LNKKYLLENKWELSLQTKIKTGTNVKYRKWYDVSVPSTVYHSLIKNNLIPDPFYADNELSLQWIAESDWCYKTSFKMPPDFNPGKPVYLVFEGLDTAAKVILNGKEIASVNNMFVKYELDVTEFIEAKNTLEVFFTSPYKYARQLEKEHGRLPVALASERVYIRKAQYSFGWDWGPAFADLGIWKPVYLLQKESNSITGFTFTTKSIEDSYAVAELNVITEQVPEAGERIVVSVSDGSKIYDYELSGNKDTIRIPNPKLWWPNGEGEQFLYSIKITLLNNDTVLDEYIKKAGIRTLSLQLKEEGQNTFRFIINGKKIFARGVNWIPADSFLTRPGVNKYRKLLSLAKDGNMNIVRVWGGGIYEPDHFYEICDELGLLVWQDFMFACASYPEYPAFIESVKEEVKQNVTRLQHHPSIAIWCGNNENEWLWHQDQKKSYTEMPGYRIYSELIPSIVKETDPARPYWESSPFIDKPENEKYEEDPNSQASGNRHQWDIWSRFIDYTMVKYDNSLFVTEFGFQGPANQETLEKVIPAEERNPQSRLFEFHNKQVEGNERIFKFLAGHLPVKTTWKDFIYLAQLNQGLALKTCLEHWRYNSPQTNGSIIWQLNDCWPVTSWSLVDSGSRPKLSYYLVKKVFRPQIVRFVVNNENADLVFSNYEGNFKGYVEIAEADVKKGKTGVVKKVKINSSSSKDVIYSVPLSNELKKGLSVLTATLYNDKNVLLHRAILNIPEWKYIKLPSAKVKAKLMKEDRKYYLMLRADKPAFFVTVYSNALDLADNCVNLLPGEEYILPVNNITRPKKMNLKIFSLNDYTDKYQ
jgi:beta-mannosidase